MNYLIEYGLNSKDIIFLKSHYSDIILSNIILKKDNVIDVIKFLKEKEFDIKYLLLNRLDIFLINFDDFKNKINKYTNEEINLLREDFSIFN